MKTEFSADSPHGKVYQAIQTDCAQHGKTLKTCDDELHHGYVDNLTESPLQFYSRDLLSGGEVLEYAYRFDRLWPMLAKHGFPVPFAADDFDPTTAEDARLRVTLQTAADHAIAEAIAEGFAPASDAYVRSVAQSLYEWGLTQIDFTNDCAEESPAHIAWKQRCGACTETSYLMYRLLQLAGLSPVMLTVASSRPTLDLLVYFEKLPRDQLWQEHAIVGVPLADGTLLQVDVALHVFDPNYPNTFVLTPRQVVAEWFYDNQLTTLFQQQVVDKQAIERVAKGMLAVAPTNFRIPSFMCRWDHGGFESEDDFCKIAWRVFQQYPLIKPLASWGAMMEAMQRGARSEYEAHEAQFDAAVRALGVKKPRAAAIVAFAAARGADDQYERLVQHTLAGLSWSTSDQGLFSYFREHLHTTSMDLLGLGLQWYAEWPAPYIELTRIGNASTRTRELQLMEAIVGQHPQYAIPHYKAAGAALNASVGLSPQEAAPFFKKAQVHIAVLQQLEPQHPRTKLIAANLLARQGHSAEAIAMLQEVELRVGNDPSFRMDMVFFYVIDCRIRDAGDLLRKMMRADPTTWKLVEHLLDSWWMDVVDTNDLKERPAGKARCGEGQREVFAQMIVELARNLGTGAAQIKASAEQQARIAIGTLLNAKIDLWQDIVAHLPAKWSNHVVERARTELQRAVEALSRAPLPLTASRIDRALATRTRDLELRLGKIVELRQLYCVLARQLVWKGDTVRAARWLQRAMAMDERRATEWFFTEVVRESFTKAVSETPPTASSARDFINAVEVSLRAGIPWASDQRASVYAYSWPCAARRGDPV